MAEGTAAELTDGTPAELTEATAHKRRNEETETERRRNDSTKRARPTAGAASRLAEENAGANANHLNDRVCVCAGVSLSQARFAGRSRPARPRQPLSFSSSFGLR